MEKLLAELGLTTIERKVYQNLLTEGASLAGDITKKTGIHRRNVYDALQRLIHKGFVGYIKENNRKKYSVTDPESIATVLRRRQQDFEKLLPTLRAQYTTEHDKSETLFFRGREGIRLIFEDQLKVGKEILVNATSAKVSQVLRFYFPKYQLMRKQEKIKTRMIFDAEYKKDKRASEDLLKIPLCSIRYIKDFNKTPMSQYIYGDAVAIVLWAEDPVAILIRQKDIAQGFRDNFELLWKLGKE